MEGTQLQRNGPRAAGLERTSGETIIIIINSNSPLLQSTLLYTVSNSFCDWSPRISLSTLFFPYLSNVG